VVVRTFRESRALLKVRGLAGFRDFLAGSLAELAGLVVATVPDNATRLRDSAFRGRKVDELIGSNPFRGDESLRH
jgi:hypothetical protein